MPFFGLPSIKGRVVNSQIIKENIEIFEKASEVVGKYFPGAGSGGEIHSQVSQLVI
jgi:hypothetical protein